MINVCSSLMSRHMHFAWFDSVNQATCNWSSFCDSRILALVSSLHSPPFLRPHTFDIIDCFQHCRLQDISLGYWVLVLHFTRREAVRQIDELQHIATNVGRSETSLSHSQTHTFSTVCTWGGKDSVIKQWDYTVCVLYSVQVVHGYTWHWVRAL